MILENSQQRIMEKPALNNSLMVLVLSTENMLRAWQQVKSNKGSPGIDGITVERFLKSVGSKWPKIKHALIQGYYVPKPVKKGGDTKEIRGNKNVGNPDRIGQGDPASHCTGFDPGV